MSFNEMIIITSSRFKEKTSLNKALGLDIIEENTNDVDILSTSLEQTKQKNE